MLATATLILSSHLNIDYSISRVIAPVQAKYRLQRVSAALKTTIDEILLLRPRVLVGSG